MKKAKNKWNGQKGDVVIGIQAKNLHIKTHNHLIEIDQKNNEALVFDEIPKIKDVKNNNIERINIQKDGSLGINHLKLRGSVVIHLI